MESWSDINDNSSKIICILVVFVILVIVGGTIFYMNTPRSKFLRAINNGYKSFVSEFDDINMDQFVALSEEDSLVSEGNLSFVFIPNEEVFDESYDTLIQALNNLAFNYKYGSDSKEKKAYFDLTSKLGDKSLINVSLYQLDNKEYTYYKDIYDKYIESPATNSIETESYQFDDIVYLIKKVKSSIVDSLKYDYFTSESESIWLNKKSVETEKVSLELTKDNVKDILIKMLTDIKNDKKCLNTLDNIINDERGITKIIDEDIADIKKDDSIHDMVINLYIKDNSIAEIDIFDAGSKIIEYQSYMGTNPTKKILIVEDDKTIMGLKLEQLATDKMSYSVAVGENGFVINGTLSSVSNFSSKSKIMNMSMSNDFSILYQEVMLGSIKIDSHTTVEFGKTFDMPNIANVIKEEDMLAEERKAIDDEISERMLNVLTLFMEESPIQTEEDNDIY